MTAIVETSERADLVQSLDRHRFFLRQTLRDVSEQQARQRSTVSELTLAGLVKHVSFVERNWARFITEGPAALGGNTEADHAQHFDSFQPGPAETVATLLTGYDQVAAQTDQLVRTLPSLDASQPLPPAPWFEPGARWTARRVLLHIIAETAQHAGHADIIREALDGAKSMG